MDYLPEQAPLGAAGVHLVLYDGVCALCNRLVQFLLKHDGKAIFNFASLQINTAKALVNRFGNSADGLTTFYVVANYRAEHAVMLNKSAAVVFVARALGWPWRIAVLARVVPKAILDRFYDLVARTRYRAFGRLETCALPRPELRRRFIDG